MSVMWIVNKENKHAVSAAKKLAQFGKPGALVMLTEDELDAFRSEVDVVHLPVQSHE